MRTIAIDFDGVIHKYSGGWKDGSIYDEPVAGAFEAIKAFMDAGYSVFILSTRNPRQIKRWLDEHLWVWDSFFGNEFDQYLLYGYTAQLIPWWRRSIFWNKPYVLGITNRKLAAQVYIDDRARLFTKWTTHVEELIGCETEGDFLAP